jgi:hypothetical protein
MLIYELFRYFMGPMGPAKRPMGLIGQNIIPMGLWVSGQD